MIDAAYRRDEHDLLLSYLHGRLLPEATRVLEARLNDDTELAERLMRLAHEEGTLVRWGRGQRRALSLQGPGAALAEDFAPRPFSLAGIKARTGSWLWKAPNRGVLASVAGFIAAVGILFGGFSWWQSHRPVAEVVGTTNCRWYLKQEMLQPGESIDPRSTLRLAGGTVVLRYRTGVEVTAHGPLEMKFDDVMNLTVKRGKLSANVPHGAEGFTVRSAGLEVIDLGTQFGVIVQDDGKTELHVFEGSVKTRRAGADDESPEAPQNNAELHALQGMRVGRSGKFEQWVDPDYEGFGVQRLVDGVIGTSGKVRLLKDRPTSLVDGALPTRGDVHLIPERQGVLLTEDITVTFPAPKNGSTNSGFEGHRLTLPAGRRVDSYLLHSDPDAEKLFAHGSVKFRRPVVAIIALGEHLAATDALLGIPSATYQHESLDSRGLERGPIQGMAEVISMKPHEIGVHLQPKPDTMDQVRILVLSEDD